MSHFDISTFLPYMLNQAAEHVSLGFQQKYKERYGMLRTEWRVLFHLGKYGAMTATDISSRSRIHKTKISRAVFDLCEKRFVKREASMQDRRQEFLHLTNEGNAAYKQLMKDAREFEDSLIAQLGAGDVEKLKEILGRIM